MGLAVPDEFLPEEGAAAEPPASAPGRLILRVEGQAEAAAFLAAYAAEQRAAPPAGVQLPATCAACGAAPGAGFEAAAHHPVAGFIGSSVIVSAACSSCSVTAVEVRGTGGVAARGTRLRQVVPGRDIADGSVLHARMLWPLPKPCSLLTPP